MEAEEITAWGVLLTGVIGGVTKLVSSVRGRRERKRRREAQDAIKRALDSASNACEKPHVDSLPAPAKEAVIRTLTTETERITPRPKIKALRKKPTK